jgi:hypothetical protein
MFWYFSTCLCSVALLFCTFSHRNMQLIFIYFTVFKNFGKHASHVSRITPNENCNQTRPQSDTIHWPLFGHSRERVSILTLDSVRAGFRKQISQLSCFISCLPRSAGNGAVDPWGTCFVLCFLFPLRTCWILWNRLSFVGLKAETCTCVSRLDSV